MAEVVIGIDSGTQSTKALVINCKNGSVLGDSSVPYGLIPGLSAGAKEQDPSVWVDALIKSVKGALKKAKVSASDVIGIGVSGQQHGFVPLDKKGSVIRPAKLWCDTTTTEECDILTESLGGKSGAIKEIGNAFLPGFTAPKVLWLKRNEPKNFKKLDSILLPHDYLNFWLTGVKTMEYGDASGTAFFNTRKRVFSKKVLNAIDGKLESCVPELISSDQPAGYLSESAAAKLGLNPGILVSAGGGDNMMGAIGTGNTTSGVVTASFGTSGTIYACSDKPVVDPKGEIAAFCDSTNKWLPLLCTMNVTVATEMVRNRYKWSHVELEKNIKKVPAGSDGLILVPYLEGERTPNIPDGTGVYFGINNKTFSEAHMARAAMEGVTMGMNYGLNRLRKLKLKPTQIRATGGGSKSRTWLQIMANIFNTEVVTLKVSEGAAYGAGIQALWCHKNVNGTQVEIHELTDKFVKINNRERFEPQDNLVDTYQQLQSIQDQVSESLKKGFSQHRGFLDSQL